ncbi:hypothetical protein A6V39_00905 [Candidatus Mycoplasma haematobovis]|uniref:Uncharacterized protein n=1 Tax=Candidatus Mycoplasma haematobovis TaxID=432608 RepID=A0A1A9QF24_9MOLU|nr:hypothetical protein [Candidatus Mycoplasma haematobovis]OAL10611.1 hypothetical protein A6V39_00905 [Candidatus Mycoplasma haematobovis]
MTSTFVKIASLGGGIATVTGGTIAVVYSLSDSSKTKPSTQSNGDESSKQQNTKQPQSITQLLNY